MLSYSKVTTHANCPKQYWHRYINDTAVTAQPCANDARIIGSTMHKGIEEGLDAALEWYEDQFPPFVTNNMINEEIKFCHWIPALHEEFGDGVHEQKIYIENEYVGYIDYLKDGVLIDFKYSNNIEGYLDSEQIHLYKYFGEKMGLKIDKLKYVFIPKVAIRKKKTETLDEFRIRLLNELESKSVEVREVEYDENKVEEFFEKAEVMKNDTEFKCNKSGLCYWCDYKSYCEALDYDY